MRFCPDIIFLEFQFISTPTYYTLRESQQLSVPRDQHDMKSNPYLRKKLLEFEDIFDVIDIYR